MYCIIKIVWVPVTVTRENPYPSREGTGFDGYEYGFEKNTRGLPGTVTRHYAVNWGGNKNRF
jgi:hypothetical protein